MIDVIDNKIIVTGILEGGIIFKHGWYLFGLIIFVAKLSLLILITFIINTNRIEFNFCFFSVFLTWKKYTSFLKFRKKKV